MKYVFVLLWFDLAAKESISYHSKNVNVLNMYMDVWVRCDTDYKLVCPSGTLYLSVERLSSDSQTQRSNRTGKSYTKPHSRKMSKWLTPFMAITLGTWCLHKLKWHTYIGDRYQYCSMPWHCLAWFGMAWHGMVCASLLIYKTKICVILIISAIQAMP